VAPDVALRPGFIQTRTVGPQPVQLGMNHIQAAPPTS
jgi:hypothetical protein